MGGLRRNSLHPSIKHPETDMSKPGRLPKSYLDSYTSVSSAHGNEACLNHVGVPTMEELGHGSLRYPSIKHTEKDKSRPGFAPAGRGGHSTKELSTLLPNLLRYIPYVWLDRWCP
jgi:hypothetical protein